MSRNVASILTSLVLLGASSPLAFEMRAVAASPGSKPKVMMGRFPDHVLPNVKLPAPFADFDQCSVVRVVEPGFDCQTSAFDLEHRGGLLDATAREIEGATRLVILLARLEIDERGEPKSCHGCQATIDLAILSRAGDKLRLHARLTNALVASGFLNVDLDAKPYHVAFGDPAVGVIESNMYQGVGWSNVLLFRLEGSTFRKVFEGAGNSSDHSIIAEEAGETSESESRIEELRSPGAAIALRIVRTERGKESTPSSEDWVWDSKTSAYMKKPQAKPALQAASAPVSTGSPIRMPLHSPTPESQVFQCYKVAPAGPFRECAPSLSNCATSGCFTRPTAYCFAYLLSGLGVEPDQRATMCAPTLKECTDWAEDRTHVLNRSLSSCYEARPDEYK